MLERRFPVHKEKCLELGARGFPVRGQKIVKNYFINLSSFFDLDLQTLKCLCCISCVQTCWIIQTYVASVDLLDHKDFTANQTWQKFLLFSPKLIAALITLPWNTQYDFYFFNILYITPKFIQPEEFCWVESRDT